MNSAEASERTCAGCRAHGERDELLRLVLDPDGRVVPDVARKLPGRGASVHPKRACIELAASRGGLSRAFSRQITCDARALADAARALYVRRLEGLLLGAVRSKGAAVGTEAARDALRAGPLELLVVAADAEGRREELAARVEALGGRVVVFGTKASLGHLLHRDELGILAIIDDGIARAVKDVADRVASLSEVS